MRKTITSAKAGAVFTARNTGNSEAYVWPAILGIQKHKGCIEFTDGKGNRAESMFEDEDIGMIGDKLQEEIYFDVCKKEEAWLVTPCKNSYTWERVDDQLILQVY